MHLAVRAAAANASDHTHLSLLVLDLTLVGAKPARCKELAA
jgi:hypothetical protein